MKKMLQYICRLFHPVPAGATALANELGGLFDSGRETLQIDPAATLPVAGRYLIYKRGSGQYYAAVGDAASFPLGTSPDAPYQSGDFLDVERFGAIKGTQLGMSAGAIAIDHLVGAAASGQVQDVTAAANGTYWVIGRATKTVAAAGQEITFLAVAPYAVTVTGGTLSYGTPA
ncbi:MAG: hypothetical protein ABSH38_14840 [Verrucomicrobiota bacterium]|jgi:hypothetical protein